METLVMSDGLGLRDGGTRPVRCCECGEVPTEQGEVHLLRIGWEGFSRLKTERLGTCPSCVA